MKSVSSKQLFNLYDQLSPSFDANGGAKQKLGDNPGETTRTPKGTRRNNNVIMTYVETTSRRRFDVIMTLLLRRVSAGTLLEVATAWRRPYLWTHILSEFCTVCTVMVVIYWCHRWIPHTKGQQREKCFHLMSSSWILVRVIKMRFELNSSHFADDIFKCIWLKEPLYFDSNFFEVFI